MYTCLTTLKKYDSMWQDRKWLLFDAEIKLIYTYLLCKIKTPVYKDVRCTYYNCNILLKLYYAPIAVY